MNTNITRRDFLRRAGVGVAAVTTVAVVPSLFERIWERLFPTHSIVRVVRTENPIRKALIAKALDNPEVRESLRQSMIQPIKTSLMYRGIGRKLLMVDELPMGALHMHRGHTI